MFDLYKVRNKNDSRYRYLFVLSIAVCFEAFGGMQLDGGAADHLNAALLILHTQRTYTTVHLSKKVC